MLNLAPLASEIKVAAVYGSIASGTETSASDIDLLIIGSVKMIELSPLLEQATGKLRRQINPTLYTPDEFTRKSPQQPFYPVGAWQAASFCVRNEA